MLNGHQTLFSRPILSRNKQREHFNFLTFEENHYETMCKINIFSSLEWLVKHYFKAYFVEAKQRKFIICDQKHGLTCLNKYYITAI